MSKILQLKISLIGSDPLIWRRVLIDSGKNLEDLHYIIQTVMDWDDDHLAEFETKKDRYPVSKGMPDMREEHSKEKLIFADEVPLNTVFRNIDSKLLYTYDFGDSWEHEIRLEKILEPEPGASYPVCTGGEYACPPEDCGGIWGYYDLLEALQDEEGTEHDEAVEWLGEDFDPDKFDLEEVNKYI